MDTMSETLQRVLTGYAVSIPELPGCLSQGESAEEALAMIRDAQRGWLTAAVRHGDPIPMPRSYWANGAPA